MLCSCFIMFQCSVTCGNGVRIRVVKCMDDTQRLSRACDPANQPPDRDKCQMVPCREVEQEKLHRNSTEGDSQTINSPLFSLKLQVINSCAQTPKSCYKYSKALFNWDKFYFLKLFENKLIIFQLWKLFQHSHCKILDCEFEHIFLC